MIINPHRFASSVGTSPGTASLQAWYNFADNTNALGDATYNLLETNAPTYGTEGGVTYGITTAGAPGAFFQEPDIDSIFGNTAGDYAMAVRFRAYSAPTTANSIVTINGGRFRITWNTGSISARAGNIVVTSSVVPAINTWYTVIVSLDNTNGIASLSVNGSSFVTATGTPAFAVGNLIFAHTTAVTNDTHFDFAAFYAKQLNIDHVTWFYNNGGTRVFSEL